MICGRYDVVTVPFPFIDRSETKRRPAVVLSSRKFNRSNHTILTMITTKKEPAWPGGTPISDYVYAACAVTVSPEISCESIEALNPYNQCGHGRFLLA